MPTDSDTLRAVPAPGGGPLQPSAGPAATERDVFLVRLANFALSNGYLFVAALLIFHYYTPDYPVASTIFFYAALARALVLEPIRANLINVVVSQHRSARVLHEMFGLMARLALVAVFVFALVAQLMPAWFLVCGVAAYTLLLFANELQDTFARIFAANWSSVMRRSWRYIRFGVGIPFLAGTHVQFPIFMVCLAFILFDAPWRDLMRVKDDRPLILPRMPNARRLKPILRPKVGLYLVATYAVMGLVYLLRDQFIASFAGTPKGYLAFDVAFKAAAVTITLMIFLVSEKRLGALSLPRYGLTAGAFSAVSLTGAAVLLGAMAIAMPAALDFTAVEVLLTAGCFLAIFVLFAANTRFVVAR